MNQTSEFRLLVIADVHYAANESIVPTSPLRRHCGLGCELFRRVINDANRRGGFDAVALMGDMVDNGTAVNADESLDALSRILRETAADKPLLVVPGNHDGNAARLLKAFGQNAGLHEISGYRFVTFVDITTPGTSVLVTMKTSACFARLPQGRAGQSLQFNTTR